MTINQDDKFISITRTSRSSGWNGLCAAQVFLTEQHPVHFKFLLILIVVELRSCSKSNLSVGSYSGGMDGRELTIGVITMKGDQITTTIGQKTITTTKECDTIYLCVYLHYPDNSVTFAI